MAGTSQFSQQISDVICSQLAEGKSLREICSNEEFPVAPSTIIMWVQRNDLAPGFAEQYARARKTQAELLADELLSIADSADAESYNAARLRVDTRKWILSKVLPKVYGDATMLKHADADGNTLKVEVTRVSDAPRQLTPVKLLEAAKDDSSEGS